MRTNTHLLITLVVASIATGASTSALAQNAGARETRQPQHRDSAVSASVSRIVLAQNAAPARETPRPQDLEPAVNTSAPPSDAARETPRPDDINPRVDTSSPAQSPDSPSSAPPASATRTPRSSANTPGGTAGAPPATSAATTSTQPGAAKPVAQDGAKPAAKAGKSLDRLELDTTQITGNRELPKVLYIVPWKRSDLGDLVGKPVNSLLDEVLTPVDRDVFRRENRYYRALSPGADQGAGAEYSDGTTPYVRPTPGSAPPAAGSVGSATKPASPSGSAAPRPGNEK